MSYDTTVRGKKRQNKARPTISLFPIDMEAHIQQPILCKHYQPEPPGLTLTAVAWTVHSTTTVTDTVVITHTETATITASEPTSHADVMRDLVRVVVLLGENNRLLSEDAV